jgi:hypothetical protein
MRINAQQQAPLQWAPQMLQLAAGRPSFPDATQMQCMDFPVSMHFPPSVNGIVSGNTQMPLPGRSHVAQPVQVNPPRPIAGVRSSAAQNPGAPHHGQPPQMTQMNIANAHKFAQNGLTTHPPASQVSQQQSQQSGGEPQPSHGYQQSAINWAVFVGSSQQIPAANHSPQQSNPNPNSYQHPQQAAQPNPRCFSESNVNTTSTPASLQTSLVRQPGQPSQPQQPLQQHPRPYGGTQAQAPTPRPPRPPQQISQTIPAYPHSASTTPVPNPSNIAMAHGQPRPSRNAISSRPHSQPQSVQPAPYPRFRQYGSGPRGVFAPPNQPVLGLQGAGTSRETKMGTFGLAVKKDHSEGGSEIVSGLKIVQTIALTDPDSPMFN